MSDQERVTLETLDALLREVHYAFLTERYGPHEAVWQANGQNVMLLTKPSLDTNAAWFAGPLRQLV